MNSPPPERQEQGRRGPVLDHSTATTAVVKGGVDARSERKVSLTMAGKERGSGRVGGEEALGGGGRVAGNNRGSVATVALGQVLVEASRGRVGSVAATRPQQVDDAFDAVAGRFPVHSS